MTSFTDFRCFFALEDYFADLFCLYFKLLVSFHFYLIIEDYFFHKYSVQKRIELAEKSIRSI